MALRAVPEHPKFAALKASLGLTKFQTLGLLEALWHFTGRFSPRGNVGRFTDLQIEAWLEWNGDPGKALEGLVSSGWLDRDEEHRLVVHDWSHNADEMVHTELARKCLTFADGTVPSARRLNQHERDRFKEAFSQTVCSKSASPAGKLNGAAAIVTKPEPEPAPEPVPEPAKSRGGLPILQVPAVTFDHSMVAQGVLLKLRLSGAHLSRNLSEVAKAEIDGGAEGLALMELMAEAGLAYMKAKGDGKLSFAPGLEKFYGEGLWRDPKLWPWKDGHGPPKKAANHDPLAEQRREREAALNEKRRIEGNGSKSAQPDG